MLYFFGWKKSLILSYVINQKFNPFNSMVQKKGFENSVDPDEMARTSHLIRIYTVCLFF